MTNTKEDSELTREQLLKTIAEMRSLIDGAYEIVELFDTKTPSQVEWKKKWLQNARDHGASTW